MCMPMCVVVSNPMSQPESLSMAMIMSMSMPLSMYTHQTMQETLPSSTADAFDGRRIMEIVQGICNHYAVPVAFVALERPDCLELKACQGVAGQCVSVNSIARPCVCLCPWGPFLRAAGGRAGRRTGGRAGGWAGARASGRAHGAHACESARHPCSAPPMPRAARTGSEAKSLHLNAGPLFSEVLWWASPSIASCVRYLNHLVRPTSVL